MDDPQPLVPPQCCWLWSHALLAHLQVTSFPLMSTHAADVYTRRRWRRIQYLGDKFWSRWRREYLQNQQRNQKWCDNQERSARRCGSCKGWGASQQLANGTGNGCCEEQRWKGAESSSSWQRKTEKGMSTFDQSANLSCWCQLTPLTSNCTTNILARMIVILGRGVSRTHTRLQQNYLFTVSLIS